MLNMKVWTDGSCLGNPGVGGYAAIMQAKGKEQVCFGYSKNPKETNNRMELKAVICVVDWCNRVQKEPCEIQINTDSQYLIDCTKKKRAELTSVSRANNDLWIELINKGLEGKHHLTFVKVAGHSDDEMNQRADKLAREQAVKARHEIYGGK